MIRTDKDIASHYLYLACEPMVKQAEREGFKVTKIEGTDINPETLKNRIKQASPTFVFFNGHGTKSSLHDNNKKDFLTTTNCLLLKETVTYARACDSICELGKKSVQAGCRSYIGYNKPFWLPKLHGMASRCNQDRVAKPVIETSNTIASQLLKGSNVDEAVRKSHEQASQYIIELVYSEDPHMRATLYALITNDVSLAYEGSGEAKIRGS